MVGHRGAFAPFPSLRFQTQKRSDPRLEVVARPQRAELDTALLAKAFFLPPQALALPALQSRGHIRLGIFSRPEHGTPVLFRYETAAPPIARPFCEHLANPSIARHPRPLHQRRTVAIRRQPIEKRIQTFAGA